MFNEKVWENSGKRWRESWEKEKCGPFSGKNIFIKGKTKPEPNVLKSIIEAGGGKVLNEISSKFPIKFLIFI